MITLINRSPNPMYSENTDEIKEAYKKLIKVMKDENIWSQQD